MYMKLAGGFLQYELPVQIRNGRTENHFDLDKEKNKNKTSTNKKNKLNKSFVISFHS